MDDNSNSQQRRVYWQQQIKQWRGSGISGAQFCKEHDLIYNRFCYWRAKLKRHVSTPRPVTPSAFVPVVRKGMQSVGSTEGFTMTLPNGISFRNISAQQIDLVAQLVRQL